MSASSFRPDRRDVETPGFAFVYLASQSPRRQELLRQIGVRFELLLPTSEEHAEALELPYAAESPSDYVRRVTCAKADAARRRLARLGLPGAPILTADTTVSVDGEIFGKPADAGDAARMLGRLAQRTHEVLTAVAVTPPPVAGVPAPALALSLSQVRFGALEPHALARYIASGEPFGKAGAYAIQGRAAEFVAHVAGSYSGIMGLPLFETAALLRAARVSFHE